MQFLQEAEALSMERYHCVKQVVIFFGNAGIGTRGGWGAKAVLQACRKVVERPRGQGQLSGKVMLVDEFRTSRVSSTVNGQQQLGHQQGKQQQGQQQEQQQEQ
ncbi:MAG: hypothetical protein ACT6R7_17320, partial [Brevundimonas aurantiaca]|uniref:hypothetical protein n=1 Tax=Brevundimonas aurantiaca TaxID=74316 RepID=UPI00403338B5